MSTPSAPRPSDAAAASASSTQAQAQATSDNASASGKAKDIVSVLDGEEVPKELPILPRPLGVPNHPSTKHASWTETMWDQETRMENRRVLIKQATQGYFHDYNRLDGHEGKTWIAPKSLIREEQALYFPDIEGHRLDPRESVHTTDVCGGKTSIVAFLTTKSSEEHVQSLTKRALAQLDSQANLQFVQINLQENPLKSLLVSMFVRALRRSVPPALHPTYILAGQNMEMEREALGMANKHVGYVYLVDKNLKIRWAGCGNAAVGEAESLERCTSVLLNRESGRSGQSKK